MRDGGRVVEMMGRSEERREREVNEVKERMYRRVGDIFFFFQAEDGIRDISV